MERDKPTAKDSTDSEAGQTLGAGRGEEGVDGRGGLRCGCEMRGMRGGEGRDVDGGEGRGLLTLGGGVARRREGGGARWGFRRGGGRC